MNERNARYNTKNFLLILMAAFIFCCQESYALSYSKKGNRYSYSITKKDSIYLLVVSITGEKVVLPPNPELKLKTLGDDVITLNGELIGQDAQNGGMIMYGMIIPLHQITVSAQFVVDKAVMEKIGSGISKVRLSTAPQHECEFKKDKIGKKLYEMFLNLSKDDF